MSDDRQLLCRFATERSESAFGELVARHLPLVYSAALRQTSGDAHLARDIAQLVFSDLVRKAPKLSENVVLAGWLHQATIFAARNILRSEYRRRIREQHAATMNAISSEPGNGDWQQIRPLLDEALDRLNKSDRDALLLRFFEQQTFAQIGASLGGTEDAARKRIARALEKLRAIMQRHGVTTTAAALSIAISANAVQAAPAGLAATLTTASLTTAGTGTTLSLLKIMTATQLKLGLGAFVTAGVVTAFVVQHQAQTRFLEENESLHAQVNRLESENEDASNHLRQIVYDNQFSDDQHHDLVRLRYETALLRRQTNDLGRADAQLEEKLKERFQEQSQKQAAFEEQSNQWVQIARGKLSLSKQGVIAFLEYAGANHGQFPASFSQVAGFFTNLDAFQKLNDNFQIVYQGDQAGITNPAETIVIQEASPWQNSGGRWIKAYGFADGHSELHSQTNGDFSAYEQLHTFMPPANHQ